jgi:hypothetical protein
VLPLCCVICVRSVLDNVVEGKPLRINDELAVLGKTGRGCNKIDTYTPPPKNPHTLIHVYTQALSGNTRLTH